MRRFTETTKWDDPWFRGLPGVHKLAFLYIIDRCNNAGFWEIDMDGMEFQTKLEQKHLQGALKGLARGIEERDGWVWVKNFLKHQKNDVLNESNPAHRQIIGLIREQVPRFPSVKAILPKGASKGLQSPIGKGKGKVTVEEESDLELKIDVERSEKPDPDRITIGRFLGRRDSTKWSDEEIALLNDLKPIHPDDMALMAKFYGADIPSDKDHRRTTIERILKNWNGELDKARIFSASQQ